MLTLSTMAVALCSYRESSSERVPLFLPSDDPKDRMVGRNNLIVGGALLSQTRMQSGACSVVRVEGACVLNLATTTPSPTLSHTLTRHHTHAIPASASVVGVGVGVGADDVV